MSELNPTQKTYFPGIDLLKMISMFMVVILHILLAGGVLGATNDTQLNFWVAWFMEIAAYVAVNCFALATGFLMVDRKFKYRKIVPLWLTVFFYTALFLLLAKFMYPGFVVYSHWYQLAPVVSSAYWYFTAYVFLFFCIPFLNIFIEKCPKKMYLRLLLTIFLLVAYSVIFGMTNKDAFKFSNGGYSAWWLIYLYLLGAGIKKYELFKKIPTIAALFGYIGMIVLTFLSKYAVHSILKSTDKKVLDFFNLFGTDHFIAYTSPTIVAASVFLMIFCLKLRLPKFTHKILKATSPLIFQVYIIHLHFAVWNKLIVGQFASYALKPAWQMVLLVLLTAAVIFLVCIAVDALRYWLFRLLHIEKLVNFAADKLTAAVNSAQRKRELRKLEEAQAEEED